MSSWLKSRLLALFALVVLSGGVWFGVAKAQNNYRLPAPTPEVAGEQFARLLDVVNDQQVATRISGRETERLFSVVSKRDSEVYGTSYRGLMALLEEIARLRKAGFSTRAVSQEGQTAVVEVTPDNTPRPLEVFCVQEDGGWRVDVDATYARIAGLSSDALASSLLDLTGTVAPDIEVTPEGRRFLVEARENARRASCQSNLKQVALGILQYTQDYDEKYPPAREWAEVIQPYLRTREIFRCPEVAADQGYGYAYNSRLSQKPLQFVNEPALMVMTYETTDLKWNAFGLGEKLAYRHKNGANYGFVDGHIKWYPQGQTPQFTFKPTRR